MNPIESSCRIPAKTINSVSDYIPNRTIATLDGINAAAVAMGAKQQRETDIAALVKTAADAARQTEVNLHNAVMAMQESVQEYLDAGHDLNSD
ncbi:hypothetical protein VB780_11035 [Leptolyngbya sp. CCNP1308]|uniref:hypothetical protein n=1 Tax=Leptolyngbya sp. CCNP1308 TaxID=3110255 RepID=UPI002B1F182F|nr:hypothetical protein [Leptolyngbya sp. CCNP1308]MEA5449104.1 hypothetical protein [Leptolyngbya sp. CCNP1308]